MTYYNLVVPRRARALRRSALPTPGVDGAILPDLPLDELDGWGDAADAAGVETVLLAAPTTPDERLARDLRALARLRLRRRRCSASPASATQLAAQRRRDGPAAARRSPTCRCSSASASRRRAGRRGRGQRRRRDRRQRARAPAARRRRPGRGRARSSRIAPTLRSTRPSSRAGTRPVASNAMADKITMSPTASLTVPDEPIIPFVEGDGTGVDIWPAAQLVMDAAAAKHGKTIAWKEVLAGQKAFDATGSWLPDETVDTFREYLIGIKGPLTTPVGGGIRSLNVALRQLLDLYVCLRPVRWFPGVPSPVKHPEQVDMVIFRENTEDIYAGLEVEEGTPEAKQLIELLKEQFGWNIREDSGVGIKPISETGSKRLIRAAIKYAVEHEPQVGHARAQGQHPEVHRGRVPNWGYELVREEFADVAVGWDDCGGKPGDKVLVQGQHRRHHVAAGAHPSRRLRRDRDDEPQRRLPLRRARRAGRRHRHRAGRQHQLRHRPRHLRGDARHRAEVRGPGQGEPELGAAVGRDDVRAPRLDRRPPTTSSARSRPRSPTRSSPTTSPA